LERRVVLLFIRFKLKRAGNDRYTIANTSNVQG
jgi:hypothetical protein